MIVCVRLFLVARHFETVRGVLSLKRCHCGNLYTCKTDTSLIPTLCNVPSVSVIERFDCTLSVILCNQHTCIHFLNADGYGSSGKRVHSSHKLLFSEVYI